MQKRYETNRYYLPKSVIKNYNVIISGENFTSQRFDSDIKWSEKISTLTTGQDEKCTTGCLLNYDYIKNHYRLIAIDFNL